MKPNTPEEICFRFQQYMRQGDTDSLLKLYDEEVVFLNEAGKPKRGLAELKEELAPLAEAKTVFEFVIKQVVQAGNIALMHTKWEILGPERVSLYAIEVARRQPDGTWRWLIGDPFTVGRHLKLIK